MGIRTYEVDLPADVTPEQGLEFVRTKAGEMGIQVEGDAAAGSFEGTASGQYRVDAGKLTLAVDKKPAFVPWPMIEGGLRKVFGEVRKVDPDGA